MKVLIIESDSSFASTLVHALEARGLDVTTADDGDEGFELAKAQPPAAIVLSVELGERRTGGFSLCNKLRRDEALKGLPLVLMSSLASEETLTQHSKLKTRADHYLQKPFTPEELLGVLGLVEEEEEKETATIDLGGIEDLDLTGLVGRDFFGSEGLLGGSGPAQEAEAEEWEELVVVPEEEEAPIALPDDQGESPAAADAGARAALEAELAGWRAKEAQWAEERARLQAELEGARKGLRGAEGQKATLESQLAEARQALVGSNEQRAALEEKVAEVERQVAEARQSAAGSEEAGAKLDKVEQELARSQERLLRAYRKLKLDAQVHQQLRTQLLATTELLDSLDTKTD